MRTIRMLSCALLVGAMAVVTPGGAASAAPAMTYTGVFGDADGNALAIAYVGCTTTPPEAVTKGDWSMTVHGTSAKASFKIFVDGVLHVAYTFPAMKQAPVGDDDYTFSVHGVTQAGLLTVSLKKDGDMTYTIAPYGYGGLSCTSVTYPGHLTS
ncbi:MAG: hypothetical protein HHJ11_02210 [Phycicoccus sp.]|nr:hypothetical protein [Phycicoccus sp.]NMM33029.1 hypothetical protein [Phycicoccus sp.]